MGEKVSRSPLPPSRYRVRGGGIDKPSNDFALRARFDRRIGLMIIPGVYIIHFNHSPSPLMVVHFFSRTILGHGWRAEPLPPFGGVTGPPPNFFLNVELL